MGIWQRFQPSTAGKWRRATCILEEEQVALESSKVEEIPEPNIDRSDLQPNVHTAESLNKNIIDLYSVGHEVVTREMYNKGAEVPFKHTLQISGPQGEIVRVSALFNSAAMVAVMCLSLFKKVKHKLGIWRRSEKLLQMANGTIVPSQAVWQGMMQLGDIRVEGSFEVFNSGGN